ncbi:MAG: hypothetical protein HY077_04550 [Elusimicrobia bacterium]|nr:hypothetical protein [Elusimicrobiota bacterium]
MGKRLAVGAMLLLFSPSAGAELILVCSRESRSAPKRPQVPPEPGLFDPAYRLAEGVSDGVYDFVRRDVFGSILPRRLTRGLKAAPSRDSTPLFDRNLSEKEARYFDRVRLAYPLTGSDGRPIGESRMEAWRDWAAAEQVSVAVDSFKDTLMERYQLDAFGAFSGEYAKDRRNWDPGFLTMSGVLGATFLYLNGTHATDRLGPLKLGVDLASGLKLQNALQGGGDARHLAALELGYKDLPITLGSEWGASRGRLRSDRLSLHYRLRF